MCKNSAENLCPSSSPLPPGEGLALDDILFRSFCEGAREGILVVEVATKQPIYANAAFARMFGYTPDEILNLSVRDLHPLEALPKVEQDFTVLISGELDCSVQPCLRKDGSLFSAQIHAWTFNVDGRLCAVGFFEDITERKRVEEELKDSEERFRALHNASFGGITIHDKGVILECNQGLSEITGYTYDELIGMDGLLLISDDTRSMVIDRIASGYEKPYEAEGVRKNGEKFPVRLEARNIQYKGNNVRVVEFRNITEAKQAEVALRESEAKVRSKLDALLDPEGDIRELSLTDVVNCNQIQSLMDDFYALTNIGIGIIDLEGNVLVGTGWQDICTKFHSVHPETAKNCLKSDTELATDIEPGTFKLYKCKNNMWDMATPIMVGETHLGNLFLGQFFFKDEEPDFDTFREQARRYGFDEDAYLDAYQAIPRWSRDTANKVMTFYCNMIGLISRLSFANIKLAQTTQALTESETRLKLVFNAVDGIAIQGYDRNRRVIFWNNASEKLYGYSSEEAVGSLLEELIIPMSSREETINQIENWYNNNTPIPSGEIQLVSKNGEELNVYSNHVMITNPKGSKEMFCIDIDLTPIRQIEKKMASFSAVVENSNNIVVVKDLDLRVVATNQAFADTAGYASPDDLIGKTDAEIFGVMPDTEPVHTYMEDDRRAQNLPKGEYILREESVPCPNGEKRIVLTKKYPIYDHSGNLVGTGNISTDITEQKKTEERLRHMEKMDAIGHLAGGVAHDFNNQLTGIMGYADMLRTRLEDPGLKRYAENILIGSRRSSDLTRKLLAFARKGQYESMPVDIHNIIHEVVEILNHSVDKRIEIKQILAANPSQTRGDPSQLQNSFLNLAINATDAMPDGGTLVIETSIATLDEGELSDFSGQVRAGSYVRISVADSGTGIPEKILPHIFEPFFTTKEVGKGTGMGLASVYGTIKQHGGGISVDSEIGQGTTFTIHLPLEVTTAHQKKRKTEVITTPLSGTILLVDDEQIMRELGVDMLASLGYTVKTAEDGASAIEFYRQNWQTIDIVILDMIMPNVNGAGAYRVMKTINPDVKVLLASGYSINGEAQSLLAEGVQGFIQKPFDCAELSAKVSELLGAEK